MLPTSRRNIFDSLATDLRTTRRVTSTTTILMSMVVIVCVLFIPAIFVYGSYWLATQNQETITTKITRNGERVCTGNGEKISCDYLAFTENEVFKNTDSVWMWKFNSSDVHSRLIAGKTCTLKVYGKRIEWLSMYRNISEVIRCQ